MPTDERRAPPLRWRGLRETLASLLGPDNGFTERHIMCRDEQGSSVVLIERHKVLGGMIWSVPPNIVGTLSYATTSGLTVQREGDGSFTIASTGKRLLPRLT